MGNDLNIVAKGDTFVLRFAFSVYKLLDKLEFDVWDGICYNTPRKEWRHLL